MIKTFHVQNYKALRDVRLELTPLHVLIGPNDSGKTSVLEALRAHSRIASGEGKAFEGRWTGCQLVWRQTDSEVTFEATGAGEGERSNTYWDFDFRREATAYSKCETRSSLSTFPRS